MRLSRLAALAAAWLPLCFATLPHSAEASAIAGLSDCAVVAVQMMDDVNSADAKPGDFFRFETINAVTVGNKIVIPARTMGYGIVSVAASAARGGRAGSLVLEPRYLVLPDGAHVGVVLDHSASDLQASGTSGNMPGYLGAIPIPGLGAAIGIFDYFHHGRDIEVKKGTAFTIFPSDSPESEDCQAHPQL